MQREQQFNSKFAALVAFKNQHGHVNAHPDMGKALSSWVYRLRRQYQDHTLDSDKRRKLDSIGFQWENPRLTNSKKKAFVIVEPSPPALATRLHQRQGDVAIAAEMLLQLSRLEARNDVANQLDDHHCNGHYYYDNSDLDDRRSICKPSFNLNDYTGISTAAGLDEDKRDLVDKDDDDDDDEDWSPTTEKENRITPHVSTKRAPTITPATMTPCNINELLSNYKGIKSLPNMVFDFCFACCDGSMSKNAEHHKMCPKNYRCNLITLDKKIRGAKVGCAVCSHQVATGGDGRHAKHATHCPRSKSYMSPATTKPRKKRKAMASPFGEATNRALFSPKTKITKHIKAFKALKRSTAFPFTFPSLVDSFGTHNHHQDGLGHMIRRV